MTSPMSTSAIARILRRAKSMATARPIPLAAPVITATFPSNSMEALAQDCCTATSYHFSIAATWAGEKRELTLILVIFRPGRVGLSPTADRICRGLALDQIGRAHV